MSEQTSILKGIIPWWLRRGGHCEHVEQMHDVVPSSEGCEECLALGDRWVHLRLCLTCGHVGCCDQSKNKHATKHFHATGHPVIQSFEPDEDWVWCYVDRRIFIAPRRAPAEQERG